MMENNLPQGWVEIELSEITNYKKGKKPKKMQSTFFEHALVYLDIRAIEKGNDEIFVDRESSNYTDKNDLIIVWDGARAGWVAKSREGAIGSTIMSLTPKIDKDFLLRYLQTQFNYIQSNHRGTGIPHVDPDIFWNIMIPIPPLPEQHRIVTKLDGVMQKVESNKQRLDKIPKILKRFQQSVLAAAVSGKLTEEWRIENENSLQSGEEFIKRIKEIRIKRYVELCKEAKQQGKRKPSNFDNFDVNLRSDFDLFELPNSWSWVDFRFVMSEDTPFCYGVVQPGSESNDGNYLIRAGDIKNNTIDISSLRTISKQVDNEYSRSRVSGGEILITVVGAGIGECGIVPVSCKGFNIARAVAKVPIKDFSARFILLWLNSTIAINWMKAEAREVARPTLNLEQLREIPLPLPSIEEQTEIVRRLEQLFAFADKIEARYTKAKTMLDKLPQSILAKAFRGELVAQDTNDEPASILLERIASAKLSTRKAEKAKFAVEKNGKKTKEK